MLKYTSNENIWRKIMSRVCAVCGKKAMSGHNVSHSNVKTNRTFGVNVQKVSVNIDGKESKEYLCTKCIKTSKKGN